MRISDWSSDVCSSDLVDVRDHAVAQRPDGFNRIGRLAHHQLGVVADRLHPLHAVQRLDRHHRRFVEHDAAPPHIDHGVRSEEHTSELQSLMRISYAVFCLKKQNTKLKITIYHCIKNTHTS